MAGPGLKIAMSYGAPRFAFGHSLTPWVKRLLIANTAVFLLSALGLQRFLVEWFAFTPSQLLTRPWGAVTYLFVHGDFWHLFVNMLVLFFFGPPLEGKWGSREFIRYFLICGLGGVALSFVFAPGSSIIGASAATYGLMLAFAMNWPNSPIYVWGIFPVKAKWLVGFFFAVAFLSAFGGAGGGIAHFAHLGGLLAGLIYLKSDWRLGRSLERWKNAARVRRFAIVSREEGDGGDEAGKKTSASTRRGIRREEALLDEVDRILEKISASGMSSLTEDERRTLDEVSRQRRSN